MKKSAGRVLIKACGLWKENETYFPLDLVNHNGLAWLAKRTVTGIEPSEDNSEYWHDMINIKNVVKESLEEVVIEEVASALEARFSEFFGGAVYASDLFSDYDVPLFVRWDSETLNTPYSAGVTDIKEGFAFVSGKASDRHTVSAWVNGGDGYTHTIVKGADYGWKTNISSYGSTLDGPLGLGGGLGEISANERNSYIKAEKDDDNFRSLMVMNPNVEGSLDQAVTLVEKEHGEEKHYRLYGEHNTDLLTDIGGAKVYIGSYTGDGGRSRSITDIPFKAKFIYVVRSIGGSDDRLVIFEGNDKALFVGVNAYSPSALTWDGNVPTMTTSGGARGIMNNKNNTYSYIAIG